MKTHSTSLPNTAYSTGCSGEGLLECSFELRNTLMYWQSNGYCFGFNGKERDNEGMGGGGSTYDYGFRIYNGQIGKFLSVDPLFKSYPMLTPYQFASNMPIWAIDLDGLEAVITNKNENTITFIANVYFVTEGTGNVNAAALKKASEELIVNQLSESMRTISSVTFNFILNYITTDALGNPLTYKQAGKMAENSKVTYTSKSGKEIVIEGPETGVVITTSSKFNQDINDRGESIPKELNQDGNFNVIRINIS